MKKIEQLEFQVNLEDLIKTRVPAGAEFLRARLFNYEGIIKRVTIFAMVDTVPRVKEKVSFRLFRNNEEIDDNWTWLDTVFVKGEPVHVCYTQGFWGV